MCFSPPARKGGEAYARRIAATGEAALILDEVCVDRIGIVDCMIERFFAYLSSAKESYMSKGEAGLTWHAHIGQLE
jgi:hypothetical protein